MSVNKLILICILCFCMNPVWATSRANYKIPPHKVISETYTFKSQETLSEVLMARGVGEKGSPFFLYGNSGWLNYNKMQNPAIRNWDYIPSGTTLTLYYPCLLQEGEQGSRYTCNQNKEETIAKEKVIIVEPMQFNISH